MFTVRIGKKNKEGESKTSMYDGISRLICTSKSVNQSLKGKTSELLVVYSIT